MPHDRPPPPRSPDAATGDAPEAGPYAALERLVEERTRLLEERTRTLEAARLDAERRAREASYLARLTEELAREDDARAMFQRVADELLPLVDADAVAFAVGARSSGLVAMASAGTFPEPVRGIFSGVVDPRIGGVVWSLLDAGTPAWIDDYATVAHPSPMFVSAGLAGVAHVPLPVTGDGPGLLSAFRFGPTRPWLPEERALLLATARAIQVHLERAARVRELRDTAAYAEALARISFLADGESEPWATARQAVEVIAAVADIDVAALTVGEEDGLRVRTVWSRDGAPLLPDEGPQPAGVGLVWGLMEREAPAYVDDYAKTPGSWSAYVERGVRSVAFVPFGSGMVLVAARLGRPRPWAPRDRDLFVAAARCVRRAIDAHGARQRLEAAALTDALTGLHNRRALDADLDVALADARRRAQPVTLLVLDVDGLKAINDTLGHPAGDALLRAVGDALRHGFRQGDRIYRQGGDEYAVLMRQTGQDAWRTVRARVRSAVVEVRRAFPDVDLSAGMAAFPDDARDAAALHACADSRMYDAKWARKTPPE